MPAFAVDEEVVANVQHAQTAETGQGFATHQRIKHFLFGIRRFCRGDIQLVTRGGGKATKPLFEFFRLIDNVHHHLAQTLKLMLFHPARVFAHG
ncbi:hypothetical protein D3C81_1757730 [compost metagenome]